MQLRRAGEVVQSCSCLRACGMALFPFRNMYPGKVYLVGGGVPLTVDGRLVGAVGVAGLPQGVDEKAARAGIAAWERFRQNMKK